MAYYGNYYGNRRYSRWDSWGRWIVLAVIVAVVLLIFFLASCITARKRRRRGNAPMYGTGWMAPQHGPVNYYGPGGPNAQPHYGNQQYQQPPPNYNASNAGYYGGQPQDQYGQQGGYYGQQTGTELQPPSGTYQPPRGGENVYQAPDGPPPQK
ncbi:MAG: hypothetical protein M1831_005012 [Alyxoria varia]|nr:MAG: hypothetical protein M1831_005012 [Alyxoria varia]